MTKKTTLSEKRAAQQKGLDEIDLERALTVQEIFGRAEVQTALEDLRALHDEADTTALTRSSTSDITALIANLLIPFEQGPRAAEMLAVSLQTKINPPSPPVLLTKTDGEDPLIPPAPLPPTE